MKELFVQHFKKRVAQVQSILKEQSIDHLYIESGFPEYYFMDDQTTFFKSNPHFLFFCPDPGQGHLLKISQDSDKPKLYFHIPDDFWHEVSSLNGAFWEDSFEIEISNDFSTSWKSAEEPNEKCVILSPNPKIAFSHGCQAINDSFLNQLNWLRTEKTPYEVLCLKKANEAAAKGHKRAKELFLEGATEWDIFMEYLFASEQRESNLPYNSIVALDESSAILHYQFPKSRGQGQTFLIDAGARFNGYCSDITRTYVQNSVDDVYKQILTRVEKNQSILCDMVRPGVDYTEIHKKSFEMVAEILVDFKLFKGTFEEAIDLKVPFQFYPHGVGHPLGLQVHDVAGKQMNAGGSKAQQPENFPYLRTLRTIQAGDVLTIEPGFYFIPMLLNPLRMDSNLSSKMDWVTIDRMIPYGGIRIEDDVFASETGPENLTRPYLA